MYIPENQETGAGTDQAYIHIMVEVKAGDTFKIVNAKGVKMLHRGGDPQFTADNSIEKVS